MNKDSTIQIRITKTVKVDGLKYHPGLRLTVAVDELSRFASDSYVKLSPSNEDVPKPAKKTQSKKKSKPTRSSPVGDDTEANAPNA